MVHDISPNRCFIFLEHLSHLSMKSSICLLRRCNQTDCFVRSLHFVIHGCPSCIYNCFYLYGFLHGNWDYKTAYGSNSFWIVRYAATYKYNFIFRPLLRVIWSCRIPGYCDRLHHQLHFEQSFICNSVYVSLAFILEAPILAFHHVSGVKKSFP